MATATRPGAAHDPKPIARELCVENTAVQIHEKRTNGGCVISCEKGTASPIENAFGVGPSETPIVEMTIRDPVPHWVRGGRPGQ